MPASLKRACVAEMPRAYIRISLCAITSYTDSLPLPGPPPATVYHHQQLDQREALSSRRGRVGWKRRHGTSPFASLRAVLFATISGGRAARRVNSTRVSRRGPAAPPFPVRPAGGGSCPQGRGLSRRTSEPEREAPLSQPTARLPGLLTPITLPPRSVNMPLARASWPRI